MKRMPFVCCLWLLLVSSGLAQKNKPSKNEPQPSPTPQVSLDYRLTELSKEISDELTGNQKTAVAVADFVDLDGRVTSFGKFLAEELITRLYKTKKLRVIERQRLDKVIAEQKLSLTEIIEASSAKRIGRILGVDAIVAGTTSELGNNFRINARIINTETGELMAAAGVTVAKDQEVCSLVNCGSQQPLRMTKSSDLMVSNRVQSPIEKPKTSIRKESNFFTFELQKCRLSGTTVMCEFVVTNNDSDRGLRLTTSYMFDDFNNQYRSTRFQLASDQGYRVSAFLVSGVQTRGSVTFDNVTTSATKITLLKLNCYEQRDRSPSREFVIEYRNVPIRE